MKTKLLGLSVNISPRFFEDLKKLLSLTSEQLNKIAKYAKTREGFRIPEEDIHKLFQELQTESIEKISSVLSMADFIYRLTEDKKISPEELVNDLNTLSQELKIVGFEAKKEDFKTLFLPNELFNKERSRTEYENAILPNLISLRILWDVRPVFKKDSTEILTLLPVALLQFKTKNTVNKEANVCSFQVPESDIKGIIKNLNESLDELTAIKKKIQVE